MTHVPDQYIDFDPYTDKVLHYLPLAHSLAFMLESTSLLSDFLFSVTIPLPPPPPKELMSSYPSVLRSSHVLRISSHYLFDWCA